MFTVNRIDGYYGDNPVWRDYALIASTNYRWNHLPRVKDGAGSRPIIGTKAAANGTTVCYTGSTSGTRCGKITHWLFGAPVVNVRPQPGDSGSPVFYRVPGTNQARAVGIVSSDLSSKTKGEYLFIPIRLVLRDRNLTLITK